MQEDFPPASQIGFTPSLKIQLIFLGLSCLLILLSACGETLVDSVGGTTYAHEYYLRYNMDFNFGNYVVHAERYGDVESIDESFANNHCDRHLPKCWREYSEFIVNLPNGDILEMRNADKVFSRSLSTLTTGDARDIVVDIVGVYRNQIATHGDIKGKVSCLFLNQDGLLKNYDYHLLNGNRLKGEAPYIMRITAHVTRVNSVPDNQPDFTPRTSGSDNWISSGVWKPLPCQTFYEKASRNSSVTSK